VIVYGDDLEMMNFFFQKLSLLSSFFFLLFNEQNPNHGDHDDGASGRTIKIDELASKRMVKGTKIPRG
jgi:hypothetical protein